MNETTDAAEARNPGRDKDKYPYIHPEDLHGPERLAVDADDVEDFIEHFTHHEEHRKAHAEERAAKAKE